MAMKLLLPLISILTPLNTVSHDHHSHHHHHDNRHLGTTIHRCGTSDQSKEDKDRANDIVKNWIAKNGMGGPKTTVTIQTYIHVIHDGTNGILTQAQVDSQMNKLNADFTGSGFTFTQAGSTTFTNNPSWYNAKMLNADSTNYSQEQTDMKNTLQQGGATDLNVYFTGIVTAGGGTLGYATFPSEYGCNPKNDGIVVDGRTIPGGSQSPYDQGATTTHEVGHWLGLYHVFEDGCADGDQVSDTNAQATETDGCPSTAPDTCPTLSGLDNIHNYMDYSDDVCMTEFTTGQVTRMTALWAERTNPAPCTALPPQPPPCFSPVVITNVLGKGGVMMQDIEVGDKVLTASGEYKTVFTFSHFHDSRPTTFIQLHSQALDGHREEIRNQTNTIELTSNHMLFLHGKLTPVPASSVKVGHTLQSLIGPQRVTKITTIVRNGLYSPITTDGTIVAGGNDIIASTYTTYTGTSHIEIANQKLVSFQTVADLAYAPYKSMCLTVSLELCNQHTELAGITQFMKWIYNQWSIQNELAKFVIITIYMIWFGFINTILGFGLTWIVSFLLVAASVYSTTSHSTVPLKKC